MFDRSKLKSKVKAMYGSQVGLAKELGYSQSSFNKKINGKSPLTDCEMFRLINFLNIPHNEIFEYFFQQYST